MPTILIASHTAIAINHDVLLGAGCPDVGRCHSYLPFCACCCVNDERASLSSGSLENEKKTHTHMIPMASPGVSPYFTIIALLFPAADTSLPRGTGLSMSVCRDRKICCPRLGFPQRKLFIAAGQRKRFGSGVLGGFFGERWMDSEPPLAEGICILKMGPSRSRFVPRKNKH